MYVFNYYSKEPAVEKTEEEIRKMFELEKQETVDCFMYNQRGDIVFSEQYTEEQLRLLYTRAMGYFVLTNLTKKETYFISDYLDILNIPEVEITEEELRNHFLNNDILFKDYLIYSVYSLNIDWVSSYVLKQRILANMSDDCDPPILTLIIIIHL